MAESLCNKLKGGKYRVMLVHEIREMLQIQEQTMQTKRPRNVAWFKEKEMLAEAYESGQILDEEQLAFLADLGISDCHDVQPTIIHNAAFQTDDLDAYDSDYDDISSAKAISMHFEQTYVDDYPDNEITSDSNIISYSQYLQETQQAAVQDTNSFVQQDSMILSVIEQMSEQMINHDPRELPKVRLVNTILKKIKYHLGKFDTVVKKRTTPDAITGGSWGFEHTKAVFLNEVIPFFKTLKDIFNVFDNDLLDEITKVLTVFNQMEATVQQCSIDKQYFRIHKKELFLDNDRLLLQIMSQDVMLCVMTSTTVFW
ncbi:hypothetical protein Tco_1158523 [Tanacetum coccineum]